MRFVKLAGLSVLGVALAAGGVGVMGGAGVREIAAAPAAEGAYKVDAVHSSVIFRIKHMNMAYFYGAFKKVDGTFLIDTANPAGSSIAVSVDSSSIDTRNEGRDRDLKGPDQFSVKEFPAITFTSKKFEKVADENGEPTFNVTGDLTLKGKTNEITAKVRLTGQGKSMRGGEAAGIEAIFVIKRADFGMTSKGLGDDVTLTVSLEGGR